MAMYAPAMQPYMPAMQPYAPAGGQLAAANNSGFGRFGFGYGNAAGSPVARSPMVYGVAAPQGQYQQPGAVLQYQQPGNTYGRAPEFLSESAMAKLKEFTVDHHWRQRAKQLVPLFKKAGNDANGLDYQQLQDFYDHAGLEFFGQPLSHILTPDIFERFDFNGDGMLEFIQAFKSLKCVLIEGFHKFGGESIKPVELTTPEQKGYTIIKELARGGQGAAILANHVEFGQVVLKTYEKSNPNAGTLEEHIAEMQVLKELQNEDYVMHAWDIFQDHQCVYCVNELMAGGDLEGLREKTASAGIPLTQEYFQNIFKQTLLGLDHIHEHGLMHCDLKEPNVMIKNTDLQNPHVAIIDFGLASVCAGPGQAGGTPGYVPPETNANHIWYPKGDIFSLGVTFFQLLADKTPLEKLCKLGVFQEGFRTMDDVVRFTATRPLPWHLVAGTYPGVMSWLPDMCNKQKKPRPRALQLLSSPFFSDSPVANGNGNESSVTNSPTISTNGNQPYTPRAAAESQRFSQQAAGSIRSSMPQLAFQSSLSSVAFGSPRGYTSLQSIQPFQARAVNEPSVAALPAVVNQPSVAGLPTFCVPGAPLPVQQPPAMQIQSPAAARPVVQWPQPMQIKSFAAAGALSPSQYPQQIQGFFTAGGVPPVQQMQSPANRDLSPLLVGRPINGGVSPVQQLQFAANGDLSPRQLLGRPINGGLSSVQQFQFPANGVLSQHQLPQQMQGVPAARSK